MKINYTEPYPFKPIPSISVLDGYWQNGTWKFNMSEISAGAASQPSWIDIILKGNTALTLVNSKADSLSYLKLFGGTIQSNLPKGYTQLDYIESDGTQYMDVDVSGNVTFIGTAQSTTDNPTTSQVLIANGGASAGHWFGVQSSSVGEPYSKRWGLGATATASTTIYGTTKVDFNMTFSDVDGQYGTVNDETLTRTTSKPTQGDWIAFAGTENPNYVFIGKIWKLQAVQNDVLVRDFVPCKNSSNIAGMYDLVSGTFFGSSTASNFVAGSAVVPTPDNPMDIVCNNGVVKYSPNMANVNEQTALIGYYISSSGVVTAEPNNWIYQDFIPVKPNTTYTLTMSSSVYYVTISEYSTADDSGFIIRKAGSSGDNTTLTITTGSTTNYIRFGTNLDRSAVTLDRVLAINWMLNQGNSMPYAPYSPTGIYTVGTVETVEITGKNLFDITAITEGYIYNAQLEYVTSDIASLSDYIPIVAGQSYTFTGYKEATGNFNIRINYFNANKEIQSQNVQSVGLGNYNFTITIPSGIKYLRYSFRTEMADSQQLELGSTATDYEPYFNGGTATAEMLLKVGTYQDIQSVIDGEVTRNVGIKVLDGTENWVLIGGYTNLYYDSGDVVIIENNATGERVPASYCTHFKGELTTVRGANQMLESIKVGYYNSTATRHKIYIKSNAFNGNSNNLKQFLADQYNSGNPVVIVYPLATATTESVTSQPLTIQAGTNIVEITQASMDNLELEVSYKAGVTVTITEIENAQLDNSVEVTIQ